MRGVVQLVGEVLPQVLFAVHETSSIQFEVLEFVELTVPPSPDAFAPVFGQFLCADL